MKTGGTHLWLLELGNERLLFDHRLPRHKLEKHFRDNTSPPVFNEFYRRKLKFAKWTQIEKITTT